MISNKLEMDILGHIRENPKIKDLKGYGPTPLLSLLSSLPLLLL